jgi:hypothetical protein
MEIKLRVFLTSIVDEGRPLIYGCFNLWREPLLYGLDVNVGEPRAEDVVVAKRKIREPDTKRKKSFIPKSVALLAFVLYGINLE